MFLVNQVCIILCSCDSESAFVFGCQGYSEAVIVVYLQVIVAQLNANLESQRPGVDPGSILAWVTVFTLRKSV